MEQEIFTFLKNISIPALIGLIFILLYKSGILRLFVDLLRSKINGDTDKTIREEISLLKNNHLHEVLGSLKRIEERLDEISRNINETNRGISYLRGRFDKNFE